MGNAKLSFSVDRENLDWFKIDADYKGKKFSETWTLHSFYQKNLEKILKFYLTPDPWTPKWDMEDVEVEEIEFDFDFSKLSSMEKFTFMNFINTESCYFILGQLGAIKKVFEQ